MLYLNLHTHAVTVHERVVSICSKNSDFQKDSSSFVSCGLHPWHLSKEKVNTEFERLAISANSENVLAIGECGLDKVCNTPWDLQVFWFQKQIELANEVQKPLIIHCVRAFQEVMDALEKMGNTQPVIFHGFLKKMELANQLLSFGAYLSFGHQLKNNQVQLVFAEVPSSRIFLETDNADCSIQDVYTFAAHAKGISVDELQQIIAQNANRVFGSKIQL
jgi:TatD DNase family protein